MTGDGVADLGLKTDVESVGWFAWIGPGSVRIAYVIETIPHGCVRREVVVQVDR